MVKRGSDFATHLAALTKYTGALDSGAHGVLVPLLYTVEDARRLVRSAKFPPQGNRGFGSPFPQERFNPLLGATDYLQQANDSILTIVQVRLLYIFFGKLR